VPGSALVTSKFPDRFGPYVLLHPLARGGMGHVTLAMFGQPGAEQICVIKRLLPQHRGKAEFLTRFRDEAELARRLSHGNLVETYSVGEVDREPYIAQAFVEGHDLLEVLLKAEEMDEPIPVPLAVFIVRELARGLAFAHDFENLNLVHRDVSPTNVRLTYSGEVKLLDFGLATSVLKMHMTEPGNNWGKIAYMAPEQMSDGAIDRRTDLYSLGVLFWELLTGDRTRGLGDARGTRDDFATAVMTIATRELPSASSRNPAVPPALDALVIKAAAPSPEKRFQTAGELRTSLAPFLPAGFDADAALSALLSRLFTREREKELRDQLVQKGRVLLQSSTTDVSPADASPIPAGRFVFGASVEGAKESALCFARDRISHRPLLIRTTTYRHNSELNDRLRSSSDKLRELHLGNVLPVTEVGSTQDGWLYFAMEHFAGTDVWHLVEAPTRAPIAEEQALRIALEICRAIEALVAARYVERHGSIDQPGRVLVSPIHDTGDLKIKLVGAELVARAAGIKDHSEVEDETGVGRLLYALLAGSKYTEDSLPVAKHRPDISIETGLVVRRAIAGAVGGVGKLRRELVACLAKPGQIDMASNVVRSRERPLDPTLMGHHDELPALRNLGQRAVLVGAAIVIAGVLGVGIGRILMHRPPSGSNGSEVEAPSPPPASPTTGPPTFPPIEGTPIQQPPSSAVTVDAPRSRPREAISRPSPSRTGASSPVAAPAPRETGAVLLEKARQAFLRDDSDEALRQGQRAAAVGAGADAQLIIGNVYFKRQEYRQAELAYREALRLDPSDPKAARRLERVRTLLGASANGPTDTQARRP
jgi:serine/threonine protein kinase